MELKLLGNSGVMVPEIGLGVWKYSGGVEPLRRGIELGAFLKNLRAVAMIALPLPRFFLIRS